MTTNSTGHLKMSEYDQDSGKVSWLADHAEKHVKRNKPKIETVPIKNIRATQSWINKEEGGGGDPVVGDYTDKPIGVKHPSGEVHVLDGHHRIDAAAERGKATIPMYTVPWPREDDKESNTAVV